MKQIELTEEHKSKLLEMCKILFPEYEDIYLFSKDQEDNYTEEDFLSFNDDYIHWFEFCLTYLSDKIIYLGSMTLAGCKLKHCHMLMELMKNFYGESGTHPIDYLYEQFKNSK